jgi:hypothetical protein
MSEISALHILKDCTWCAHRVVYKKAVQKKYELERCGLTRADIAPPSQSLLRRCERFKLIGCSCQSCNL